MNTLSKGDILSLQHSVYTSLISLEKVMYNLRYVSAVMEGKKTKVDFFRSKQRERYDYKVSEFYQFIREFKADLLNSIEYERRYLVTDAMSEERIQILNSIDMTINQLRDDDILAKLEDHIDSIITDAKREALNK